jgi:hypothetical protein
MAGLDPAIHAALLRKRAETRPPRGPRVALSPLGQDRADGDAWMAGSSPAMTVQGVGPETSSGLIRPQEPHATGPYACFPTGSPSAAIAAATSDSGDSPTSTVTTPGSSGVGSSSVANWLFSSEAGIYS